jgi:hypothetical protein
MKGLEQWFTSGGPCFASWLGAGHPAWSCSRRCADGPASCPWAQVNDRDRRPCSRIGVGPMLEG